jgi:SIT family siderophore-iron:H+ symporter-like MFS transporter
LPLIISLYVVYRRAKKAGALDTYKSPLQLLGPRRFLAELFWQLDVIGIILLVAVFALILVPFTIAGGTKTQWQTAKVIAPLVIGVLCILIWILWEMKCKHPMIPFRVSFFILSPLLRLSGI